MKVCIVGAGSIGGLLAVRLAHVGHDVSVVARGAQLEAIRSRGLTLVEIDGSEKNARVRASSSAAELGTSDVVVLAVKAHQIIDVAPALSALCNDETAVMTAQNGIPWWYFQGVDGAFAGKRLESVDPEGKISNFISAKRIIGSVVYPAAELTAPGVVKHIEGLRFSLGEIDGSKTARAEALSHALTEAGFKAPIVSDLRAEIWTKLWGNMSFNPISALTHATLEDICLFEPTRRLAGDMMAEAQAIAEKLGIRFRVSIEKRIAGAQAVGAHKTSMLQDVEAGRALETRALIGAVLELAEITNTPAPTIRAVNACVELLAASLLRRSGRLLIQSN